MLERKNIDRVFQENLKDLDVNPSKKVWSNIEVHLTQSPRKRSFELWQKLSGAAMAIMFLLASGFWYNNLNSGAQQVDENSIIIGDSEIVNSTETPVENKELNETPPDNLVQNSAVKSNAIVGDKTEASLVNKPEPVNNVIVTETDIKSIYQTIDDKYIVNESDFLQSLKSDETSVTTDFDRVNLEEEKTSDNRNKWSVGTTFAPVYYSSIGSGSPIDEGLADNSKSSDNAVSIGLKLNYQLNNKINLQSGINRVELAYITKNVGAVSSSAKYSGNNIDPKNSGVILTNTSGQLNGISSADSKSKSGINGDLNQTIQYFELPLEMKYNLYESKFGIDLVGGFSTYVLTNNSVSMIAQNQIIELGKANNLNSFNFSGNFGVDFDYKISQKWFLNVAPMFKYQFNTYSNDSGNFQPYYFGVYSGLNYRF